MKRYLFIATALAALASCSDNEFLGDNSPNGTNNPNETKAIVFSSGTKAVTRAAFTGETAAKMLNENFVFFGTKTVADTRSTVFDHYIAKWFENTANTTASNSNDWEYVGYEPDDNSSLPTGATQSIKYWDYAASQYDFAAYSFGKGAGTTPTYAEASKMDFANLGKDPSGENDFVYKLTGTVAELKECYISDLVTAYNTSEEVTSEGDSPTTYTYKDSSFGQVVTLSFRSLASKIRLAFYETIPGYSVKDLQFYNVVKKSGNTDVTPNITEAVNVTPKLLSATDAASLPIQFDDETNPTDQELKVYFPKTGFAASPKGKAPDTDYNKAHVVFSSTGTTSNLTFDALDDFAGVERLEDVYEYLGRTSNTATYAGGLDANNKGTYYTILPNEAGVNLMIRVKYTLVSTDGSDEEITVDNATAVIPLELASWKPNYAYTYIFKISDMTNGTTGVDKETGKPVMGLTPITLNAVVVDSEDGVQETITTVSEPSITTYMAGKVVTEKDEYKAYDNHPIYIVVNNGSANVELITVDDASTTNVDERNAKLYTAKIIEGTNATGSALNTISEESVDNALRYGKFEDGKNLETTSSFTVTDANGWKLVVTKEAEYNATNNTKGLKSETAIPAAESPTGDVVNLACASFVPEIPTSPATVKYYVFQYKGVPAGHYGTYTPVPPAELAASGTDYYTYNETAGEYEEVTTSTSGIQVIKGGTVYYTKGEDIYEPVTGALAWGTTYYYQEGANWTDYKAGSLDPKPSDNKYYIKKDYKPVVGDLLTEGETYWYQDSQNNNAWVSFVAGTDTPATTPQGGYYTKEDNYVEVTTLTTGETYWYQDSESAWVSFVAGANDPVQAGGYYTKNDNNYIRVPYATLTAGNTYYTTDRGAGKFTATGTEEVDAEDKYFNVESGNEEVDGKYMYKVIKVVQ